MDHVVTAKAVVGSGDATLLLEVQGQSVRLKRRGKPEVHVPLSCAAEVARFLLAASATPPARA
ncbi:MAG TPA: hypothetical protein VHH36_04210 [Candidatus Thermoplasmatota archaeon]|nr:hypothetical protein [Candidatus Thermoplasmatota archaeon]